MTKAELQNQVTRMENWIKWCDSESKKLFKIDGEMTRTNMSHQRRWAEVNLEWLKSRLEMKKFLRVE